MAGTSNDRKPAESRRRLLKSVAAGGSALGLSSLPGQWAKPTVASVILPAHAQTSGCVGTLANCPSGELFSTSTNGPGSFTATSTILPPGVSLTNGTLDGSFGTSGATNIGPCPSPCETADGQKYFRYTIAFYNSSVHRGFTSGVRCGGEPVGRIVERLDAVYSTASGAYRTYSGTEAFSLEACKYLTGSGGTTMTIVPLGTLGRRKFF